MVAKPTGACLKCVNDPSSVKFVSISASVKLSSDLTNDIVPSGKMYVRTSVVTNGSRPRVHKIETSDLAIKPDHHKRVLREVWLIAA